MINSLNDLCWAETLKFRRSRAPIMSLVAVAMPPLAAALLLLAAKDPSQAALYAWVTLHAQITELGADWPGYFRLLEITSSVGGLITFSLLMIWIFGREHADKTAKELLTLPIPRELVAASKILVAAPWCLFLQCVMAALGIFIGSCLGIPGFSKDLLVSGLARMVLIAGMTFGLALPFGFLANSGRGTMAAVGALFLVLFFATLMSVLGLGKFFPWSIPEIYAACSSDPTRLGPFSYVLVLMTGLAGALASMAWWRWAEQY
jgi:ABC-2 type transport system permease protein